MARAPFATGSHSSESWALSPRLMDQEAVAVRTSSSTLRAPSCRRSTLTPAMSHWVGVCMRMPRRTADRMMAWLGPHARAQGLFASRSRLAAQANVAASSSSVKKAPWMVLT
eukprot:5946783-Amphidinium_carterae.1